MNEKVTPNAIKIYGSKNINKPNKPLKFEEFSNREYWVNPVGFAYSDPSERLIFFDDNIVFKVPSVSSKGFDEIMKEIS